MRKLLKICFILIIILGQMLVNWLLSELDEVNYQRHSLVQLEVRQPIINFYTMLLLAGVIRPVEDGNINGVDMDFEVWSLLVSPDKVGAKFFQIQ